MDDFESSDESDELERGDIVYENLTDTARALDQNPNRND